MMVRQLLSTYFPSSRGKQADCMPKRELIFSWKGPSKPTKKPEAGKPKKQFGNTKG
jgi:hypothetical protein